MTKPVIVYDGECRFCTWGMNRVRELDKANQFDYAPRQMPGIEDRFPILRDSDFNVGMRLIAGPDAVYVGADAVYQIYRRLPPYHLVAWVYRLPGFKQFFCAGYALIARYRHVSGRVACDMGACTLPYGKRRERAENRQTP